MTTTNHRCEHCGQMFNSKPEFDAHTHSSDGATNMGMNRPGDAGRGEMDSMGRGGDGMRREGEQGAGMGRQADMGGTMTGTQTGTQTGTWRCEACGSEFRSRSEWEDHGRMAHNR